MNYSEFTDAIAKKTEKTAGEDFCVCINRVTKNNNTKLDGLVIKKKGQQVSPAIYLNDYYPKYKNGMSIDMITEKILSDYHKSMNSFDLDIDSFKIYEKMRDKVAYKLINYKMNEELLTVIPHKKYLDLAVVYYVVFSDTDGRTATSLIHNTHLEAWGVDSETLDEQAAVNTPRLFKAQVRSMGKLLEKRWGNNGYPKADPGGFDHSDEIIPESLDPEDPYKSMFVLTNETGVNGAACLLYKTPLARFGKMINRDFYVLPSSIHELILVPKFNSLNKEELSEMVRDINRTEVSADEVLSDHVYEYDVISVC